MINVTFNLATSKDLFTLVVSSDTELTLESISSILNGVIKQLGDNNESSVKAEPASDTDNAAGS